MASNPIYPANGLEIDFLGLPMVFNDGQAENTLQTALTNNNFFGTLQPEQDSAIVFDQGTPISLWFVVDVVQASAAPERHWALTSYDALHDAAVALNPAPGDWDVRRSDDQSGNPLNDSLNGWRLTPREDVPLLSGQSLVLTLTGLKSGLPDGPAYGYIQVNIPNLDSRGNEAPHLTKVIGPITKSRVMIAGDRMGIGTGSPNSTLEVNGAVWARGGAPGTGDINNNGFFFDGVGDTDSGMTSLSDGNLTFYANGVRALTIHEAGSDDAPNVNAFLAGNLTINSMADQLDSGKLSVDSDVYIGGDVQSQGRIQDVSGFLMLVGAIIAYGGSEPPPGWLLCDGKPVPEGTTYDELRGVLDDGATPDLQSRFIVGAGRGVVTDQFGTILTTHPLNSQGGAESVTLDMTQIPSHTHSIDQHLYFHYRSFSGSGDGAPPLKRYHENDGDVQLDGTDATGGGLDHENRPPYYALTYIIKY